jgi:hypothetical protein
MPLRAFIPWWGCSLIAVSFPRLAEDVVLVSKYGIILCVVHATGFFKRKLDS